MDTDKVVTIDPFQDQIFNMRHLGGRWRVHPKVALKRARELGIPILQFNARAVGVRLSDVLRAEAKVTV
jgi:hypothetical protein